MIRNSFSKLVNLLKDHKVLKVYNKYKISNKTRTKEKVTKYLIYFLFFLNVSQTNNKGFVGYGVRELTLNETNSYCSNQNLKTVQIVSLIKSQVIFTSDFMVRSFTSGCYYYSTITGKWSSLVWR